MTREADGTIKRLGLPGALDFVYPLPRQEPLTPNITHHRHLDDPEPPGRGDSYVHFTPRRQTGRCEIAVGIATSNMDKIIRELSGPVWL